MLPTFATAIRQRIVDPGFHGPVETARQVSLHTPKKNFAATITGAGGTGSFDGSCDTGIGVVAEQSGGGSAVSQLQYLTRVSANSCMLALITCAAEFASEKTIPLPFIGLTRVTTEPASCIN